MQASGEAVFTGDIDMPAGGLHAAYVTSTQAGAHRPIVWCYLALSRFFRLTHHAKTSFPTHVPTLQGNAGIAGIDASAALALPGVVAFLSAK